MSDFSIKSEQLIDFTLRLQRINDVALPFAVQNSLNETVKDVKKRTLAQATNKMFDVKKKTFFKTHSAFKAYNVKQFNYNINRLKAEVMITKGANPKETAAEQLAEQPIAGSIKRSINPAKNKPQGKTIIDILKKKPEFYDAAKTYTEGNSLAYIRRAKKAKSRGAGLIIAKNGKGHVNRVMSIKKRKPTKSNPRSMTIRVKSIASYHEGGVVNLKKQVPFLTAARDKSVKEKLNPDFIKQAEIQFERAMKR